MDETIITKELLIELGISDFEIFEIESAEVFGLPQSEAFEKLRSMNYNLGSSETYIRLTGQQFTSHKRFRVFDSVSGQNITFEDEESAKQKFLEIAAEVFKNYMPIMATELRNENGDSMFIDSGYSRRVKLIIE